MSFLKKKILECLKPYFKPFFLMKNICKTPENSWGMAEMTKNPNPALKFLKNSLKIVKSHLGHFGQLQLKNNFYGGKIT